MRYQFKVGDKGKQRDGNATYEVLATSHFGDYSEMWITRTERLGERALTLERRPLDGRWVGFTQFDGNPHPYDLLPPTQKRTVYLNVYDAPSMTRVYPSAEGARSNAMGSAIAVAVPITFEFTPRC